MAKLQDRFIYLPIGIQSMCWRLLRFTCGKHVILDFNLYFILLQLEVKKTQTLQIIF